MQRAFSALNAGSWDPFLSIATVSLDLDHRCRRRFMIRTVDDRDILVDLKRATRLHEGDALVLQSGAFVLVHAALEPVLELRCASIDQLMRLTWHLGNRHIPIEFRPSVLRIRPDHVLVDLARKFGAEVTELQAPFEPEDGAYAHVGQHHDHSPP